MFFLKLNKIFTNKKNSNNNNDNITETTDGFTDGTKSKSRWDFDEFKGFIFFNSIWTIVFYKHPKRDFWGEVASIKWSFAIGPKRH